VPVTREHGWLRFDEWRSTGDFVKGKQYEFRFALAAPESSTNYYYREGSAYEYGWLRSEAKDQRDRDLVCRVWGRMDQVDSTYWGFNVRFLGDSDPVRRAEVAAKASTAAVGLDRLELPWKWIQSKPTQGFSFEIMDGVVTYCRDTLGCEIVGLLDYCTKWASTHIDSIRVGPGVKDTFWSLGCPPRNLYVDTDSDSNYWGRYVDAVANRYGNCIRTWEVWNEPNHIGRFWKYSNTGHYGVDSTVRASCSLYMRLCEVAANAVKMVSDTNVVLVGAMSQVEVSDSGIGLVRGKDWLRLFYDFTDNVFWDGVSVHPYQGRFNPSRFEADAETLRAIMRSNGDFGELWITELGWRTRSPRTERSQAVYLCETFVSAKASEVAPSGGYDRMCWYTFLDGGDHYGLLDQGPSYRAKPALYASSQTNSRLTGSSFEQRVLMDDGRDGAVRMYEFENDEGGRMWVCWRHGDWLKTGMPIEVRLPAMSDELRAESLAYKAEIPTFRAEPAPDGWLSLELNERPVFVWETGRAERPDLVVDSVRVEPAEPKMGRLMTIRAWIRNVGNRTTPEGYATRVDFCVEGESFGGDQSTRQIRPGETGLFESGWVEVSSDMTGPALVSARANPAQRFVELDMDNNRG